MTDPTIQSTARTLPGSWDEEKQQQVGSVRFGFLKFDLHNWNHAEFQVCLFYVRSPLFLGGWPHSTFILTSNTWLNNEMVNVFMCFFPYFSCFILWNMGSWPRCIFSMTFLPQKASKYSSSKKNVFQSWVATWIAPVFFCRMDAEPISKDDGELARSTLYT